MSSVFVKSLDKCKNDIIRVTRRLILKLLISLTTDFPDSFEKLTKQLLLFAASGQNCYFQSSFTSRIPTKHTTSIQL